MLSGSRAYRTYVLYSTLEDVFYSTTHPLQWQEIAGNPAIVALGVSDDTLSRALRALEKRHCLQRNAEGEGAGAKTTYIWPKDKLLDATLPEKLLRRIRKRPGIYSATLRNSAEEYGVKEMAVAHALQLLCKHGLAHYPEETRDYRERPYFLGPYDAALHTNRRYARMALTPDVQKYGAASREEATILGVLEQEITSAEQSLTLEDLQKSPAVRGLWAPTYELEDGLAFLVTQEIIKVVSVPGREGQPAYAKSNVVHSVTQFILQTIQDEPGVRTYDIRARAAAHGLRDITMMQTISRLTKDGLIHFPPQTKGWNNRPYFPGPLDEALHEGRVYPNVEVEPPKVDKEAALTRVAAQYFHNVKNVATVHDLQLHLQEAGFLAHEKSVELMLNQFLARGWLQEAEPSQGDQAIGAYAWLNAPTSLALAARQHSLPTVERNVVKEAAIAFFRKNKKLKSFSAFIEFLDKKKITGGENHAQAIFNFFLKKGWIRSAESDHDQAEPLYLWTGLGDIKANIGDRAYDWVVKIVQDNPGIRKAALAREAQERNIGQKSFSRILRDFTAQSRLFQADVDPCPENPAYFAIPFDQALHGDLLERGPGRQERLAAAVEFFTKAGKPESEAALKQFLITSDIPVTERQVDALLQHFLKKNWISQDEESSVRRYTWTGIWLPPEEARPTEKLAEQILSLLQRRQGLRKSALKAVLQHDGVGSRELTRALSLLEEQARVFRADEDPRPSDPAYFSAPFNKDLHGPSLFARTMRDELREAARRILENAKKPVTKTALTEALIADLIVAEPSQIESTLRRFIQAGWITQISGEAEPLYQWGASSTAQDGFLNQILMLVLQHPGIRHSFLKMMTRDYEKGTTFNRAIALLIGQSSLFYAPDDPHRSDPAYFAEPFTDASHGYILERGNNPDVLYNAAIEFFSTSPYAEPIPVFVKFLVTKDITAKVSQVESIIRRLIRQDILAAFRLDSEPHYGWVESEKTVTLAIPEVAAADPPKPETVRKSQSPSPGPAREAIFLNLHVRPVTPDYDSGSNED